MDSDALTCMGSASRLHNAIIRMIYFFVDRSMNSSCLPIWSKQDDRNTSFRRRNDSFYCILKFIIIINDQSKSSMEGIVVLSGVYLVGVLGVATSFYDGR